jgi:hypothetical protein
VQGEGALTSAPDGITSSPSQHNDARCWFLRPAASRAESMLAHGAAIIAEKRVAVLASLGFSVSAGVHA